MTRERMMRYGKQAMGWVVALVVAATAWSCSAEMADNSYSPDADMPSEYITTFGELNTEQGIVIHTDAGVRLQVVELGAQISVAEMENRSGRVMFNYTILGNSNVGGFDVRLNRLYPLVVKDMAWTNAEDGSRSAAAEDEWMDEDFISLLEAPYMPYEVSVGGGCVNVNVVYMATQSPEENEPEVELYYDAAASTEDTAVMQLVGKEYEDTFSSEATLRNLWFSFRITEQVEPLLQEVGLYAFYWCWWKDTSDRTAGIDAFTSVMTNDTFGGGGTGRTVRINEL